MYRLTFPFFAMLALVVSQSGCGGDKLPLAPTSGIISYQGSPVPNATVVFQPDGGPPAIANTDDAGRFELKTGGRSGVMPGTCKVAVTALEPLEHEIDPSKLDPAINADDPAAWESSLTAEALQAMANRKSLIPEKYSHVQTSGLVAEIEPKKKNEFTFELTD